MKGLGNLGMNLLLILKKDQASEIITEKSPTGRLLTN